MKKIILSFIAIFLVFNIYKTAFAAKHYTSIYYQGAYSTVNKQIHVKNYVVDQLLFNNKVPIIKNYFLVGKDNFLALDSVCSQDNNKKSIQIILKITNSRQSGGENLKGNGSTTLSSPNLFIRGIMHNIKIIGYCNNKAEIKFHIINNSKKMIRIYEKLLVFPYKTYYMILSTKDIFAIISNEKGKVIGAAMPPTPNGKIIPF